MKTAQPRAISRGLRLLSDRHPLKRRRIRPRLEWMEDRTLLSTFNVLNTDDAGPGSLRQAILDSNAAAGGTNTIDFTIAGSGVQTIAPLSALPAITNPVLIDGDSQPGYAGTPLIELSGSQAAGTVDGLTITGSIVTVRGLDINNFSQGAGIHITGSGATNDWIYGNFLGTDPTGAQANGNNIGIEIDGGASSNWIGVNPNGGTTVGDEGNVISGNGYDGVNISEADDNVVAGDRIGTDATGEIILGNSNDGVEIDGSLGNTIGGTVAGAADVISGNANSGTSYTVNSGVELDGSSDNVVEGDFIGTDATGTISLGNLLAGVEIDATYYGPSTGNTIGGTSAVAGNLITDNGGPGVAVTGDSSVGNQITANRIFGNTGQAIDLGGDGVTENGTAPRQGPNNLQNFPIVVTAASGQVVGWLGGSTPDTMFGIDLFASSGYGPGGAGEAEDYLGTIQVTTDASGQATFDVPFAAPAGLPILTATATDPAGNTSEVSALRPASFQLPTQKFVDPPGQPLVFSSGSGDAIAVQDPAAGPFDPIWDLTLSVTAGTLTLSTTANLVGSGDGTGSLSYQGLLSAIDAALANLTYTPAPGYQGITELALTGMSPGATPLQSQVQILVSNGQFVVTTTADSGPGSLRQAILETNLFPGATPTIGFAIPGPGVQTIEPLSSLPAITSPVLIDGWSQPGFAGTPLIELKGTHAGGGDGLTITGAGVTVRGLDVGSFSKGAGIHLTGQGATGDWVYGNFLGTDPTGTQAEPNHYGVEIDGGASGNLIGTNGDGISDVAERNLISGNGAPGVLINGKGTNGNSVAGNFIGTNVEGDVALDNGSAKISYGFNNGVTLILSMIGGGVVIQGGASHNTIGTSGSSVDDAGQRNIIAGSAYDGIDIVGAGTDGNLVAGNYIGTDPTGTIGLGIARDGVLILDHASSNRVGVTPNGGASAGDEGNVISGTGSDGVRIFTANDNVVAGNKIGTDATGAFALANSGDGVEIDLASGNTIGGNSAIAGNLITDNGGPGVAVTDRPSYTGLKNPLVWKIGVPVPFFYVSVDNQITANRIFGNTGQAIDLGNNGMPDPDVALRQGPNNLQKSPTFVIVGAGQTEGLLGGSEPDTAYRIDVFASAGYGPGGAGEAQDYLGSIVATTDATGQVTFAVPFTAPVGLPVISATATDPDGNTSQVSTLRTAALEIPAKPIRLAPDQSVSFSAASGDPIALQDPEAGPFDPIWDLTLSVPAGTLTLSSLAGLAGTGDGTGSLSYQGSLSAIDASLAGLIYTAPPGTYLNTELTLNATSTDATPVQSQVILTDGLFAVTTTADTGLGSLRQAILDSNITVGGSNTINFAIPGIGVQTIAPASPLPAITNPLIIDGATQPGYAGAPLIAIVGQGTANPDPLTVNSDVTLKGVAIGGAGIPSSTTSTMLTVESIPISQAAGDIVTYQIVVAEGEELVATAQAPGATTSLSLLDAQGGVVVQSDALSAADPVATIDTYIAAGVYSLQVHETSGHGSFTLTALTTPSDSPFQVLTVPAGPVSDVASIAEGDFNGDGRLDLAVVSAENATVSILIGNGDGTFQPAVNYPVGVLPIGIVTGDFAGNGKLDLAVTNEDSESLSILLGNGDGTFQPAVNYSLGQYSGGLVAGDFSGNGKLDLAVIASTLSSINGSLIVFPGTVSILMGNGDGTFQPAVNYSVGREPSGIVAEDFSGNGKLDLAVANAYDGTVSILLGNGDGTFQPAVDYPAGNRPTAIVAGDFSGNGKLDLAVTNENIANGSGTVLILMGNGDGTFQPAVNGPSVAGGGSIAVGDYNGDGRLDLAIAAGAGLSILMGNGDGTFQNPVTIEGTYASLGIVAGDFTRNGRADLAVAIANGVSIFLNQGGGTFQDLTIKGDGAIDNAGVQPDAIATGDFSGDGVLDMAVADEGLAGNAGPGAVTILLGNGDGTFRSAGTYTVGAYPDAIVAGDFNGDGRLDLAVTNELSGTVSILLGDGDGRFQPAVDYSVGSDPSAIVAGDFSGNGKLDLAVTSENIANSSGTVSILMGNGDGTFQPAVDYPVGNDPFAIVAGDFSGNGELDLAVANYSENDVSILMGNGDGTFQPAIDYPAGNGPEAIVAGDFSGDGRLDLAVVDARGGANGTGPETGTVSVLMGNGDGTFQPPVTYSDGGDAAFSIVAGDFRGDGKLDLAVTNTNAVDYPPNGSGTVSILLGNGDGTFQPAVNYSVGNQPQGIIAADFTGDGHLDLAVADLAGRLINPEGSNEVFLLLGKGDGTFSTSGQLAINRQSNPLIADVNGDGTADVLVVDGAGDILYRQGIPGQPGSFEPPVTVNPGFPSRDIAWVPAPVGEPVLASVDARDDAVSIYAYRDGTFVRVGSLATGQLPAQIIAADLTGDGWDDLVVRNAGDGTLTVYFGGRLLGPISPLDPPTFTRALTIPVGLGVSDVQAIDTSGDGYLDLVVTNELTGQVSVVHNSGSGTFTAPAPYRAGTGLTAVNPGATPEVTSLETTAGVAAGPHNQGGPPDLVAINPGTDTLGVLDGLGGGRFANPAVIDTQDPAKIVRMGDFSGTGLDDLAVLTASGVSIYLADGKGGFSSPVTYDAGADATGLTVTGLLGNGKLDLLVGNAYGDVLILVGNGDGTFRPFEPVKAAVALAVADLTGNGALDFVFADQSLNQVSVVYGSTSQNSTGPQVIGNQTTGVLAPGAVLLHDMNGDGIPDLIVANSGGNNVLVYPGLGNGQFGPPIGGTKGFAVGTDPTGLTVADLNGEKLPDGKPWLDDLLVADTGSNDVSVLLGQGSGSSWTMIPGARIQTDAGPVATVVGKLLGGNQTDLAVANSGANNVQVFPSVGSGFFNDQPAATKTYAVGQDPSALFLGDFNGLGLGLATLNAGSNNGTLISNAGSANPVIQSFATGGNSPTAGFAGDFNGNGFTDLVVGNNGDGHLALLLGGSDGLSLSQSLSNSAAPNPTAVSFGGVTDGVLSFYVSTAGHESALEMAFNLSGAAAIIGPGTAPLLGVSSVPGATIFEVARLGDLTGSAFDLLATLVTLTILPENLESELESSGGGGALLASFSPGGSVGLGQGLGLSRGNEVGGGEPEVTNPANAAGPDGTGQVSAPVDRLAPWAQFAVGLDQAWQELRARLVPSAAENVPATGSGPPRVQGQAPPTLAPQPDPSRSEPKSRSGSNDGTKSPLPAKSKEPAGAATNGVWRSQPGAGMSVSLSSRAGFPPVLAAVDAALEELGASVSGSNRLLRIVPPATDGRSDSASQTILGIAAASMAMSMTWERAISAARYRREARRVPRRVKVP